MRVSLESDPGEFVKQVAGLRRNLNQLEVRGAADGVKARLFQMVFVPYLTALRTELRASDPAPWPVLAEVVSELMGNLASTLLHSMFEPLPEEEWTKQVDALLGHAAFTILQTRTGDTILRERQAAAERDEAAAGNVPGSFPRLVIENPPEPDNVITLPPRKS